MRFLALLALLACLLRADPLAERIEALEQRFPAMARALWGAKAVDLETGRVVLYRNGDRLFVPASNTKLFTTALALSRLGPDHRFHTLVLGAEPDPEGVIQGPLILAGGGDPTLSPRAIPYRPGGVRGRPYGALESLAHELWQSGLRRVGGDVVGDDSAYVQEPYPPGWAMDDSVWEYGAPVSALTLHDNFFRLRVRPAASAGSPAAITLDPPLSFYTVNNRVTTVTESETSISVDWPPGARELTVWGAIRRKDGRDKLLAIRDPAEYAASTFADLLRQRGIAVAGLTRAKHFPIYEAADLRRGAEPLAAVAGVVLARHTSPPLFEVLKIVNKVSQNLHAELVLREVGRARRNIGSRVAGLEELKGLLAEAGIADEEYHFEDGSGLSPLNLVTPAAVVKLLVAMDLSVERDGWLDTLPVGGEDGTLSNRFRGSSVAGRVAAKTGTMSHVSALAGYADHPAGHRLAFSVMVNNYDAPDSVARRFIDQVVGLLLE